MSVQVRCGDVGVATYWVESGRPTLSASLVFRQGIVDETLATSGRTHLLEHLALHGRAKGALQVNGSVSLLHTRFDVHGAPDAVAATLSGLVAWLSEPDVAELARERSVLRAESVVRGSGEVGHALLWRYGAQGPGLSGFREPGLARATPEAIVELAAAAFTRDNCVLVLDGPPPRGLRLELPGAELRPPPTAVPSQGDLPGAYLIPSGVLMSGVAPRSVAATVLAHVLREQFVAEFRERDGSAYAPWSHYEPVDDDSAAVLWASDADHVLRQTLAAKALVQLDRVAGGSFRTALVMDAVDQIVQTMSDPYNVAGLAHRAALDHLRQAEFLGLDACVEEVRSVRFADVSGAAEAVRSTLLLGIGGDALWRRELPMLSMKTGPREGGGRSHLSKNFPALRERLVVGPDLLQVGSRHSFRAIHRDAVVGLLTHADGRREVVDRDGWSIVVEPTLWRKGDAARSAIDAMVPDELHLPLPDRGPELVPRPVSALRRLSFVAREGWAVLRARSALILLVVGVPVVGVAVVTAGMGLGGVLGAFALGAWLWRREVERGLPPEQRAQMRR